MTSTAQRREERYEGLQAEISFLKARDVEREAEMLSLKETVAQLMSSMTNSNINLAMVSTNLNPNQPSSSSSHLAPTPQRHSTNKGKTTSCASVRDVTEVLLTSIVKPGVTIAKGVVLNKDPLTKVGGLQLGIGYWEVSVQVAMVRQEALMRPHGRYKTIGEAIGASIAWPTSLCVQL